MWTVCAQPDGSMSSILQSTGFSQYVLVHIVGPLAATECLFWNYQETELHFMALSLHMTWKVSLVWLLQLYLYSSPGLMNQCRVFGWCRNLCWGLGCCPAKKLLVRNLVVACRDASFPKRYQRSSLVVVWVLI